MLLAIPLFALRRLIVTQTSIFAARVSFVFHQIKPLPDAHRWHCCSLNFACVGCYAAAASSATAERSFCWLRRRKTCVNYTATRLNSIAILNCCRKTHYPARHCKRYSWRILLDLMISDARCLVWQFRDIFKSRFDYRPTLQFWFSVIATFSLVVTAWLSGYNMSKDVILTWKCFVCAFCVTAKTVQVVPLCEYYSKVTD